jgi:DNA polymerase/3'-5' exonuclease PolX
MYIMTNREVAERLLEYARTLHGAQHLFRARAYRNAAFIVERLDRPITELSRIELGRARGIGERLAFTIETLARTGQFVPWAERKSRRAA